MGVNLIIIAGIVSFFLLEKIVANYLGGGSCDGHTHSHSHNHTKDEKKDTKKDNKQSTRKEVSEKSKED